MPGHPIVAHDEWIAARRALLTEEKEFSRRRDELARRRRELPWTRIDKPYVFQGPDGAESLAELFGACSQLIVYHFMFDPEWSEGCKSCSFLADHYNPAIVHLRQRDVEMVTVSRAPLAKLQAFERRMGWTFKWVSSFENEFNRDFHVTFSADEVQQGPVQYNYGQQPFPMTEAPGLSVFVKDEQGHVFHSYSTYARGLDLLIGAYNFLDLVPKGRDEDGLAYTMEWIRHHDRYGDGSGDPLLEISLNHPADK